MIYRSLKLQVCIIEYIRLINKELKEYNISDKEWEDLKELALMLASFDQVTRRTQGNNQSQGSIWSVFAQYRYIANRLEKFNSEATSISSVFYSTAAISVRMDSVEDVSDI